MQDKTFALLSTEIEEKCHKLDVKEKEFQKWNKPARYIAASVVVIGIMALIYTPQGENVHYPWQSYAGGIYFLIGVPIAFFFSRIAHKYKITGFETNTVQAYRAYQLLEKYQKDNLQSQLEKAQRHIEDILFSIQKWGGDSSQEKPPFMSLSAPIDDFIENLDNRLIPAIVEEDVEKVKQMLDMLSKLTALFIGDNFNEIASINKEIEDHYEDVSEGEKTALETIKQHKHVSSILVSLGIIAGGGIIAYSTRFIKSDISVDTQILAWVGISIPFVIWYLHTKQKS